MILALDGPDGAGKSTQIGYLIDWARRRGLSVRAVSKWEILQPEIVPLARFLSGTDRAELRVCIAEMPSPARLMFLAWMNTVTAERASQASEDLVVLDGYWIKHAASELLLGCDSGLVDAVTEAIAPVDLVVYVDVSPAEALRRKGTDLTPYECGTDPTCDPRRFLSHQTGMRQLMLEWAHSRGWPVIAEGTATMMNRQLTELILPMLALSATDLALPATDGTS
ncbi:MAG: thymidylate kinase [Actinomycetota bacterium]|nr:thymidylate kinase [Actinomycetota bacterium]MDQ2956322.1 thymidylate kinase [Actinomycetota bacterium]